jgi:dTDP-4-dehydrorhamnose 3,5-epimerase
LEIFVLFNETPLSGAYTIDLNKIGDERGFFARLFCQQEFVAHGLQGSCMQANNSLSRDRGTLRGLHYQLAPKAETKLVRCIQGVIYDLILDIRPDSATFGQSFGAILTQENRTMMYVPQGFAHGFLTLSENAEVLYLVSESYCKELERGIRWDDPAFGIVWPETPKVISDRDRSHPDFSVGHHLLVEAPR